MSEAESYRLRAARFAHLDEVARQREGRVVQRGSADHARWALARGARIGGAVMDLVEFLRSRLDEEEASLTALSTDGEPRRFYPLDGPQRDGWGLWTYALSPTRVRREVAAKRALIEGGIVNAMGGSDHYDCVLRVIASIYVDHDDYDTRWAVQ